jgi:peptidoglycan/LPS O-acetylase OafA/YrhL
MPKTIQERLDLTAGRPAGFDYLRLGLALATMGLHSIFSSYGVDSVSAVFDGSFRPLARFILPAFFALSGFLVAGSLARSRTIAMFLGLRLIRIYPALAVEVLLSAFLLGPLVTDTTLADYFTNTLFFEYLLNVIGDVHFLLPGVFTDNPLPQVVNFQLWTVPFELYCYAVLALAAIGGLRRRRIMAPVAVVLTVAAYGAATLYRHHGELVVNHGALNGALLIATFLAGITLYSFKDVIPFDGRWGVAAAILTWVCLDWAPGGDFFAPFPAAYLTIYLGLLNPSRAWLRGTDYSYGIFLYGFVIQQTVVHLFPPLRTWWWNLITTVPPAVLIAAASWHFVERPAQNLKTGLRRLEDRYVDWLRRRAGAQPGNEEPPAAAPATKGTRVLEHPDGQRLARP